MGGACGTYGGVATCKKGLVGKTVGKRAPRMSEIILKCVFKK
jgi:hypothetical protein